MSPDSVGHMLHRMLKRVESAGTITAAFAEEEPTEEQDEESMDMSLSM